MKLMIKKVSCRFIHESTARTGHHAQVSLWALILLASFVITVTTEVRAREVTSMYEGVTLNANLEMAEGKQFADGIVLILHGVMGHNKMEIIEASQQFLFDNGVSSLAINLSLGIDNRHGMYDCDAPARHRLEDSLDELTVWIDWLRDQGADEITLMGHSRGANQVMVFMDEKPAAEIKRLVFLAPATIDTRRKLYESRYGKIDDALAKAEAWIAAGRGDELMDDTDFMFCPKGRVTPRSFVSAYRDDNKFQRFHDYLPSIKVPVLIIIGAQDERQPDTAEHVTPYVDGASVQVTTIDGAGHFFRDFNIEEALETALAFIAST